MASSKLLLPSSAAVFQSSPVSSTSFLCDRNCHLSRPTHPLIPHTHLLDALKWFSHTPLERVIPVTVSRDGVEAIGLSDEFSTSDNDDDDDDKDDADYGDDKTLDGKSSTFSQARGASPVGEVEGALSKYVWSQPRRETKQLSREARASVIESIVSTELNILTALDRVRFKLAPPDFGSILKRLLQEKKWDKVGLVFDWMKVNKKLRPQSLSLYISMTGKAGFAFRALRAYNGLTDLELKQSKYVCNALLKALVDAGRIEKAFALFEEMKAEGFSPDVYTYSTLIAGCAKRPGEYARAKKYMDELSTKGLTPNSFVYSSMVHVCGRFGLEKEAKTLFEEMQANGIKPVAFHYAPLLNMYAEKKKPEEAEKLLEEFRKTGLPVNEVMMNCLIKAYSGAGQLEQARRIFDDLQSPGDISYSLIMGAYCKAGFVEKAQLLFEELKNNGVQGNYAYSILISAYSRLGRADMVLSLTKELQCQKKEISDPVLFNSMLKSFCELGMMDAVMNTLKRMNEESVSPDRATFNILICFFCKQRMFSIALRTLNDLKVRKFRPNRNTYAPSVIELSKVGKVDQALEVYFEMKTAGVRPSEAILCPLIDAFCEEKRLEEAVKYFEELLELGLSPLPSCTENVLTLAGSKSGILGKLLNHRLIPLANLSQVNLVSILSEYEKQGAYASMHKLLDYAEKENISVGSHERWEEMLQNLKQVGQMEILAKLSEQTAKMQLSAASLAS